jgi:hypothetical protein
VIVDSHIRRRRLAVALMATTTIGIAPFDMARAQDDNWPRFFSAGYQYCDASLLGNYWGVSTDASKSKAGMMIARGMRDNVEAALADSRRRGNHCNWEDLGYTYDDAVALGRVGGLSPDQAKAKVAALATGGGSRYIDQALGHRPS